MIQGTQAKNLNILKFLIGEKVIIWIIETYTGIHRVVDGKWFY